MGSARLLYRMGSTFERSEASTGPVETDWSRRRALVLERDGYECQHCRRRGGERGPAVLQVHRVDSGADVRPTLVTLCRYCHDRAHRSSSAAIDRHLH